MAEEVKKRLKKYQKISKKVIDIRLYMMYNVIIETETTFATMVEWQTQQT